MSLASQAAVVPDPPKAATFIFKYHLEVQLSIQDGHLAHKAVSTGLVRSRARLAGHMVNGGREREVFMRALTTRCPGEEKSARSVRVPFQALEKYAGLEAGFVFE